MSHDRAAFAGQIADVRVHDLLLTILEGRHTGVASFQTEIGSATLWFRDGEVVDADMGRHHMEAAVRRLLPLVAGSFEVEFKPIDRRKVITTTTADLIAPHVDPEKLARGTAGADDEDGDDDPTRISGMPSTRATGRTRRPAAGWRPTAGGGGRASGPEGDEREAEPPRASAPPQRPSPRKTMSWNSQAGPPPDALSSEDDPRARLAALRRSAPAVEDAMLGDVEESTLRRTDEPAREPSVIVRFAPPPATAATSTSKTVPAPGGRLRTPVPHGPAATPSPHVAPPIAPPAEPVAHPVVPRVPTPAPAAAVTTVTVVPSTALPPADAVPIAIATPEPSEAIAARAHLPEASPAAPPSSDGPPMFVSGAVGHAVDDEGSDQARRTGRSRRAAAARAVPFEPERLDRTLMRAAPFPPARPAPTSADAPAPTTVPTPTPTPTPIPTPAPQGSAAGIPPGRVRDTFELPAASDDPAARASAIDRPPVGLTMPPPGATPPRGATERFSITTGPRGTFVLPDSPLDDITERREAGVPEPTAWPDSVPLDLGPPQQQVTPAPAPAVVGRYEVLLRIARGGMGTVYLCRVTGEGGFRRLFALKVIRDHLSANPEYVAMLLQEARIASRLHHPNVVSIVDIGTLANQHYLVMDYVEGCTFSELLKAHPKSRPPQVIVPILIDALTGLHSAHTLTEDDGRPFPLVHCDFSPQNMLVGANGICRIADFGISKAADALPDKSGITRGKPGYLSPEQVLGHRVDPRSDIFSAGIVLWNALTGERLFDAPTPEATLDQVLNKPIPRPSTVGVRPPACFDAICLTALERDPNRRYQSAEQMLVELRRAAVAHDLLATQSDVAKWVQDTFGHQIELRRQAAGIAPRPIPAQLGGLGSAAIVLSGVAAASGGHPPPERREGSDTGAFSSAGSRTAILRSDLHAAAPMPASLPSDAGLGARARAAVFVLSALVAGAIMAVLIVQPDLLRGGVLDDSREFHPWTPPPPEGLVLPKDSEGAAEGDGKAQADAAAEGETDAGTQAEPAGESEGAAPGQDEGSAAEVGEPPPAPTGGTAKTPDPALEVPADPPASDPTASTKPRPKKKDKGKSKPKPETGAPAGDDGDDGGTPTGPEPVEPAPTGPEPKTPEPKAPAPVEPAPKSPTPAASPFPTRPKKGAPPSSDDEPSIPLPP